MYDEKIREFRDGIFALRTRRFGTVAEIMIKELYQLEEARSIAYDKHDKGTNQRIEIKFSTVMKENEARIREDNVIEQCIKANLANRAMLSTETGMYKFDCNIQQVKCTEFDILYYGLFFADVIEIFSMTSQQVAKCPGYSDHQHRGNQGEGQFHLNQENVTYHKGNYFQGKLTYGELYKLFESASFRQAGQKRYLEQLSLASFLGYCE